MKLREITLLENAKALTKAGAGRIDKKYIASTVEYVSKIAGIPKRECHILGSTGKNPTSGDIDLGVDSAKYTPEHVHARMMKHLGNVEYHHNKGMKIYSYVVPIVKRTGEEYVQVGGKVQVDFIFTPSVDWATFAYHSEGVSDAQTSYKGAVRTILLKAVAAMYHEPGIDFMAYDPHSEELVVRVGRTFDLTHGLRRIFQFRPERKIPSAVVSTYVKTMKTVHTIEELKPALDALKKRHPGHFKNVKIDVADHEITINDPAKALKMMFPGSPVGVKDVRTAEQILDLISSRFTPDMQVRILTKAKNAMEEVAGKMRVPDLDAYIKHALKKKQ